MHIVNLFRHLSQAGAAFALTFIAFAYGVSHSAEISPQKWSSDGQIKRPYIFTQQNNVKGRSNPLGGAQYVRLGWPLQVQLPGNPAVWAFSASQSRLVEPHGHTMVYSPHRIEDTDSIFVFDFVLSANAKPGDIGVITLTTARMPDSLNKVIPLSIYSVEFTIIDPH